MTGFFVFVTAPHFRVTDSRLSRLLDRLQAEGVVGSRATIQPLSNGEIRWPHGPKAYVVLGGTPDGDDREFVLHLAEGEHLYEMFDASCVDGRPLGRSPFVLEAVDFRCPPPEALAEMMAAALGTDVAFLPSYWG